MFFFLGFCSLVCSWFFLSSLWLLFLCLPLKCGHFLGLFPDSFAFSPFLQLPWAVSSNLLQMALRSPSPSWIPLVSLGTTCGVSHLCLTLCDHMDCSPPGSFVNGILQARKLEWVLMPSFRGSSRPRNWTRVSCVSFIAGGFFTGWAIREALGTTYPSAFLASSLGKHIVITKKLFKKIVMPESHFTETDLIALGCVTWVLLFFFSLCLKTGNLPN